jgi:hypothetical protein
MSTILFEDIKSRRIAGNWNVLNDLIDNKGFPPGHVIGRRRIWTEREVLAWIEAQPTEKLPARGAAKANMAKARTVEDAERESLQSALEKWGAR